MINKKFMKTYFYFLGVFTIVVFSGFYYNKQPVKAINDYSLTKQIGMAYTFYTAPDSCKKAELYDDSTDVDIEFELSDDEKRKIHDDIEKQRSKISVKNNGHRVGVLKDGSCGYYPVLDIYMDCQDQNNPNSSKYGWTGDSYVTSLKNIHLSFCVITDGWSYFERTNKDYAVLLLDPWDANTSWGQNKIIIQISNERTNNQNLVTINSSAISGQYGDCYFGHYDNKPVTRLSFFYYPKLSNQYWTEFPNISSISSYGVFGRFGKYQGYIYSDDEDGTDNVDYAEKYLWSEINLKTDDPIAVTNIPNIFDGRDDSQHRNTLLYISKATNCATP